MLFEEIKKTLTDVETEGRRGLTSREIRLIHDRTKAELSNRERPRISKITFYGVCANCGRKVDVTPFLDAGKKLDYVETYGFRVDEKGKAVCRYEEMLRTCPACCIW